MSGLRMKEIVVLTTWAPKHQVTRSVGRAFVGEDGRQGV